MYVIEHTHHSNHHKESLDKVRFDTRGLNSNLDTSHAHICTVHGVRRRGFSKFVIERGNKLRKLSRFMR